MLSQAELDTFVNCPGLTLTSMLSVSYRKPIPRWEPLARSLAT